MPVLLERADRFRDFLVIRLDPRIICDPRILYDPVHVQHKHRALCRTISCEACKVLLNDAVLRYYFPMKIAQDWKLKIVLGCERLVGKWQINADPDDMGVEFIQPRHRIANCAHFLGAHAGESAGEEHKYGLQSQKFLPRPGLLVG